MVYYNDNIIINIEHRSTEYPWLTIVNDHKLEGSVGNFTQLTENSMCLTYSILEVSFHSMKRHLSDVKSYIIFIYYKFH